MNEIKREINPVQQIESDMHFNNNQNQSRRKPLVAVDHFWLKMAEIYGGRFTSEMGDLPNDEWKGLFSRLNRIEIERGYKRMKTDERFADWPPTVIRFENLCKPRAEDLDLPDTDTAYQMAIGNHFQKHKAVAWTLKSMGSAAWNVKNSVEKISRGVWNNAYQKYAIDWLADGNIIPEIRRETSSEFRRDKTQADWDAHSKFMDEMSSMFGNKNEDIK